MDSQTNLKGARILLVDDNEINREVALVLLTDEGLVVDVATDGQQAVDMLARERYDCVLMDCRMPVMDGFAATRALRERPELRDLPVIAMTGDTLESDRRKALAAGMNDHIAKPINIDEVLATLARWIPPTHGRS
jgi:CheY-like chemotaxis protein